ncbi:hypothetical protein K466DRAFT_592865 [Polyporus arcularius HHB13444]|uniref:Uncharacterized protein n=1 Tax=Polyporus arcularius HHB13444 TaxID=1314778 RepID=A0A5C3NLY4_9APHY|nr:hypothetical protein K466DRAFT_592865 [Polyporus arcularius HHB13444]
MRSHASGLSTLDSRDVREPARAAHDDQAGPWSRSPAWETRRADVSSEVEQMSSPDVPDQRNRTGPGEGRDALVRAPPGLLRSRAAHGEHQSARARTADSSMLTGAVSAIWRTGGSQTVAELGHPVDLASHQSPGRRGWRTSAASARR